jgi:uncharacterized protein YpbB
MPFTKHETKNKAERHRDVYKMTRCEIFKTTFSTYDRPMYSRKKVVLTFETELEATQFVEAWNEVKRK